MKTRVLFLDDEPLALQGLERMLRSCRGSYEMQFVQSGAEALELMAADPPQVVVADMRMPEMDGAQFLNEVRRRHPCTVRLVLSGHADRGLIFQCVGAAHLHLSKPCQPDALKTALTRAARVTSALGRNGRLLRTVLGQDRFPCIPSIYITLVELLLEPSVDLDKLSHLAAQDPGMTLTLLKLVNSAFFGTARPVVNAAEALACLGLDTFKTLVFSVNAFCQFEPVMFKTRGLEQLWQHSLAAATLAKQIVQHLQGSQSAVDLAFTAGLLHDIGKFVLLAASPDAYADALARRPANGPDPEALEKETFGLSHAEIGGCLLELWGLPPVLVAAVDSHHGEQEALAEGRLSASAVRVANALVHEQAGPAAGSAGTRLDQLTVEKLGLSGFVEDWRKQWNTKS